MALAFSYILKYKLATYSQCVYCLVIVCRSGEFPLSWKVFCIIPVYKCKGFVTDPQFFVQLLSPYTYHGFERIIYTWHISSYIPSTQFRFVIARHQRSRLWSCFSIYYYTQALECHHKCQIVLLNICDPICENPT